MKFPFLEVILFVCLVSKKKNFSGRDYLIMDDLAACLFKDHIVKVVYIVLMFLFVR